MMCYALRLPVEASFHAHMSTIVELRQTTIDDELISQRATLPFFWNWIDALTKKQNTIDTFL